MPFTKSYDLRTERIFIRMQAHVMRLVWLRVDVSSFKHTSGIVYVTFEADFVLPLSELRWESRE